MNDSGRTQGHKSSQISIDDKYGNTDDKRGGRLTSPRCFATLR